MSRDRQLVIRRGKRRRKKKEEKRRDKKKRRREGMDREREKKERGLVTRSVMISLFTEHFL